jgi:hypothetical protein
MIGRVQRVQDELQKTAGARDVSRAPRYVSFFSFFFLYLHINSLLVHPATPASRRVATSPRTTNHPPPEHQHQPTNATRHRGRQITHHPNINISRRMPRHHLTTPLNNSEQQLSWRSRGLATSSRQWGSRCISSPRYVFFSIFYYYY